MPETELLGMGSFFLVIGFIVRTFLTYRRQIKIAQLHADVQTKLLDRFASGSELGSFLSGESGRRFLEATSAEQIPYRQRILGSVQAGLILAVSGGSLAALGFVRHDLEGFVFLGVLACSVGVGFLLAAGAALALSHKWGLMDGTASE